MKDLTITPNKQTQIIIIIIHFDKPKEERRGVKTAITTCWVFIVNYYINNKPHERRLLRDENQDLKGKKKRKQNIQVKNQDENKFSGQQEVERREEPSPEFPGL